jgi:hypothetical protein
VRNNPSWPNVGLWMGEIAVVLKLIVRVGLVIAVRV